MARAGLPGSPSRPGGVGDTHGADLFFFEAFSPGGERLRSGRVEIHVGKGRLKSSYLRHFDNVLFEGELYILAGRGKGSRAELYALPIDKRTLTAGPPELIGEQENARVDHVRFAFSDGGARLYVFENDLGDKGREPVALRRPGPAELVRSLQEGRDHGVQGLVPGSRGAGHRPGRGAQGRLQRRPRRRPTARPKGRPGGMQELVARELVERKGGAVPVLVHLPGDGGAPIQRPLRTRNRAREVLPIPSSWHRETGYRGWPFGRSDDPYQIGVLKLPQAPPRAPQAERWPCSGRPSRAGEPSAPRTTRWGPPARWRGRGSRRWRRAPGRRR